MAAPPWPNILLLLVIVFVILIQVRRKAPTSRICVPPGPRTLPFIGNLLDFPKKHLGREFRDLSSKYGEASNVFNTGDIVHLQVLGRSIVLLGTYDLACEIFEKRATNYSDRPPSVMIALTNLDWLFAFKNYTPEWRHYRRVFHNSLMMPSVLAQWQPLHVQITHKLLADFLNRPDDSFSHLDVAYAATVLRGVYGIDIFGGDTKSYHLARRLATIAVDIITPGRHAVEAFQFLQRLPSWFPWTAFRKLAADWRCQLVSIRDQLFDLAAKDGMTEDSALFRMVEAGEDDATARIVAGTAYPAGVDTTRATMHAFMLAMMLFPESQKHAQDELDSVVGPDRLPQFSDLPNLPYVRALLKEVSRWHVVAPIGVAHCSRKDDEVRGYHIPAGSIVIANAWAMSRDPAIYPDPECFSPERFMLNGQLNPDVRDPADFVFGFGRRACPGRALVEDWLFIVCSSVLHAFDISVPLDQNGVPTQLKVSMGNDAALAEPEPFECCLHIRDSHKEELVRSGVGAE